MSVRVLNSDVSNVIFLSICPPLHQSWKDTLSERLNDYCHVCFWHKVDRHACRVRYERKADFAVNDKGC